MIDLRDGRAAEMQESTPLKEFALPLAVLVYLARSPQQTAARDRLLDLLWADNAPDAARQAVWYLRKRIGDEALEAGDGNVRLAIAIWLGGTPNHDILTFLLGISGVGAVPQRHVCRALPGETHPTCVRFGIGSSHGS